MNRLARAIYQATFSAQDRIEIYDDFRQYLLDGRGAKESYQKLIDNYSRRGKKPGDAVAQILTECAENLGAGFGLADSLREWIPVLRPMGITREVLLANACQNIHVSAWILARNIAQNGVSAEKVIEHRRRTAAAPPPHRRRSGRRQRHPSACQRAYR
ncbi:hypothetical protein MXF20_22510 [Pantoea dispersa]|uniref:hypothetical protein n=1 Tax=Pantoea dispersa TaxID=59814 RepID=UPI002DBFE595|nr:hypothetical protein [Pantoea dispersa]MEB5974849.1 hypothetical protein [Pantoea dispersa]